MREVNRKIYGKRAFQAEETANTKTLRQDGSQNGPETEGVGAQGRSVEDVAVASIGICKYSEIPADKLKASFDLVISVQSFFISPQ